jgi:general secretion pathway protein C
MRRLPLMTRIAALASRFETAPGSAGVAALNRRVAYGVAAVVAVAVVYKVVTLAAIVVNETSHAVIVPVPRRVVADTAPRAVENVADAHLFGVFQGEAEASAASQEAAAPDTTLDVKLTGILFGKDPQHREAIIASSGHERTYRAGQEIDSAGGATVRDVLADSVLLERQGAAELLRLVRYVEPPRRVEAVRHEDIAAAAATKPSRTRRNDFLRLMRKSEDGQVGFTVMAGPNKDAFDTLGLQSNDVITGIDGVAFGERGGDSLLRERLAGGGSLTLTVLRSGTAQEIHVDANRLLVGGG